MLVAVTLIVLVALAIKWRLSQRDRGDLDKIPGPKYSLWQAITSQGPHPLKLHQAFQSWKQTYGSIVKATQAGREFIVISDYESVYEVLVKSGKQFAGRITDYKSDDMLRNSGIFFNVNPDNTWKVLRKVSHRHLRQFGDGLSRLENIITDVADEMLQEFKDSGEMAFNPGKVIFDTALNSIAFLITGERTHAGDPLIESMREYEDLFFRTFPVFSPIKFQLLAHFPFLRHLGFDQWEPYQKLKKLHNDIWQTVKHMHDLNPESSIFGVFKDHIESDGSAMTEEDAHSTAMVLLLAGVATTSSTFTLTVNILAHHKDIQEKLYMETARIREEKGRQVSLNDRPEMPYTRAFVLEVLRHTTVVTGGVRHRATEDTVLKGYRIPVNTQIITSLWNLHHDEAFWVDPFEFRPDRFLNDVGDLVPVSHPNRTHLMPFGAGPRVCLGETLAMARIFMWTSMLVGRFEVTPAINNAGKNIDSRHFPFWGVLKSPPYMVHFQERNRAEQ